MANIEINFSAFNSTYERNRELLVNIVYKMHMKSKGLSECKSTTIESFEYSYDYLYNIIVDAVRLMLIDWEMAKYYIENIERFDEYYAACISGCEETAQCALIACNSLFDDADLNSTDMGLEYIPLNDNPINIYCEWFISATAINDLEYIIQSLESLKESCWNYKRSIDEFSESVIIDGNFANAMKMYISEVHIVILDKIDTVASELISAIRQYQLIYEAKFPEGNFKLNKNEIEKTIRKIHSICEQFDGVINNARGTIAKSCVTLSVAGIISYGGNQISNSCVDFANTTLNDSISKLQLVIEHVDENEQIGLELVSDVIDDVERIKNTIEIITPMGGYRVLGYKPNSAESLLFRPNLNDMEDIEIELPAYNNSLEYFAVQLESDANIIELAREYVRIRIGDETEVSDALIYSMINYFNYLKSNWTVEQAEILVIYAASNYRVSLLNRNYQVLEQCVERQCPSPEIAPINAANWAMRIANDQRHGYNQDTRSGGIDYDCSSLVMSAYINAGVPRLELWPTSGMISNLENNGFLIIGSSIDGNSISIDNLSVGDILLRDNHTEIYVGNGYTVSASYNERYPYLGRNYLSFHQSEEGDELQTGVYDEIDLSNPLTLDQEGEIQFHVVNVNGYLRNGWSVYRYVGDGNQ